MGKFLGVVTRCYKRPAMLGINKSSLKSQTDPDYEQVFIVDDTGRGIWWANRSLEENKHRVHGEYIYILDDDTCLIVNNFIRVVKQVARKHNPDVILFKIRRPIGIPILPDERVWGKIPLLGHIDTACFTVKEDIWKKHIKSFGTKGCGDYHFIKKLYDEKYSFYWLDRIVGRIQRVSQGRPG